MDGQKVEPSVMRPDQGFNLEPDVSVSSPVTRQKAAAAKQLIENHYKNYLQGLQDRKERRRALQRRAAEAKVSSEEEEQLLRNLEKKETEYMRLQRHKIGIDDFELLTLIGKGAFGEVRLCRAKTTGEVFAMKKLKKSDMLSRGQAHPWFKGVKWDTLYEMEAAYKPIVTGELDTQNFEKFPEVEDPQSAVPRVGPWRKMLTSKDSNFIGYTFKKSDMLKSVGTSGIDMRANGPSKPPSLVSLFGHMDLKATPLPEEEQEQEQKS
ncbi:hypothetical protein M8C21_030461 [Ambrosia artemisiifolia]|uniref:non-specific serine/threonine protein kinase n=1 Tax=Ambrosia artemisiifolia TaxID=4212 RepID=A0AAD5GHW4_AMBAR|nr:hypothetical protein M8C21_020997 [Ambrosia artemisiifolia]KAI7740503.1 hypothetical protein M8C21_030461 [Ambrosia artemisiifolia]